MKKLIICLMLAVFCLSMTPLLASDHNPYKDDGLSDKPAATRDHPWDPYKYENDSTSYNSHIINTYYWLYSIDSFL